MEIKRIGSQPSAQGPAEWFSGRVRIHDAHRDRGGTRWQERRLDGEADGRAVPGGRDRVGVTMAISTEAQRDHDALFPDHGYPRTLNALRVVNDGAPA
jgi:hypothetical protein